MARLQPTQEQQVADRRPAEHEPGPREADRRRRADDPIQGTITYSHSIAQAGTVSPFGATKWNVFNITNQAVTAVNSAFVATFTLENPITFNVTSPKTSIADENDAALTNANYTTAAS